MPEPWGPNMEQPLPKSPDHSQLMPGTRFRIPDLTPVGSSDNQPFWRGLFQRVTGTFSYPEDSVDSEISEDSEDSEEAEGSEAFAEGSGIVIDGLSIQGNMIISGLPGHGSRITTHDVLRGQGSHMTITGGQDQDNYNWVNGLLQGQGPNIIMGDRQVQGSQAFINGIPEDQYFALSNAH
jgi:hypothetical protein